MTEKVKIYGFNNGGSSEWYEAMALGSDGIAVHNHICSHEYFMPHDLGMDGRSDWGHDSYNKQYGVGNWETEFVPSNQIKTHEGLQAAIKLAKERLEKGDKIDESCQAGVTVTLEDEKGNTTKCTVTP